MYVDANTAVLLHFVLMMQTRLFTVEVEPKACGRAANSATFYATCNPTESGQLYGRDETIRVYVSFTFNARKLFSLMCAFSRQLKLTTCVQTSVEYVLEVIYSKIHQVSLV